MHSTGTSCGTPASRGKPWLSVPQRMSTLCPVPCLIPAELEHENQLEANLAQRWGEAKDRAELEHKKQGEADLAQCMEEVMDDVAHLEEAEGGEEQVSRSPHSAFVYPAWCRLQPPNVDHARSNAGDAGCLQDQQQHGGSLISLLCQPVSQLCQVLVASSA